MRSGHEAGEVFIGGILEFEAHGVAVKDVGWDRVVTNFRGEGNFTVMNFICSGASLKEGLSGVGRRRGVWDGKRSHS